MRAVTLLLASAFASSGCLYLSHEPAGEGAGADRRFCGADGTELCTAQPGEGDRTCYYAADDPAGAPVAEMVYHFESTALGDAVRVLLVLGEQFVDNSYGAGSSDGYGRHHDRPHRFAHLTESDHAQYALTDGAGETVLEVKLDYLSAARDTATGYRSLGVWGGDGGMVRGDRDAVLTATTSLDENFNVLGCALTVDSPPAASCDGWEQQVIYAAWYDRAAFGPAGFGRPSLDHIHASPSRMDSTVDVVEGPCP